MNDRWFFGELEPPETEWAESLDSLGPVDRMQAIGAAMQLYFGSEDWLKERRRQFPGLAGRPRFSGPPGSSAEDFAR